MSTFEVPVVRVTEVKDHPNADRLSLIYFRQFVTISAKLEDGSHRYQPGDLVVYVPENAVVPEYLLKRGFWNHEKNKGMLAGTAGNRVKPVKLRGILSEGIMFAVDTLSTGETMFNGNETSLLVMEGDDVASYLGITKYEPEIPARMAGELISVLGHTVKYDIENMKKYPNVLTEGEMVVYTEKIHGSNFQLIVSPTPMADEIFCDGHVAVCSKGLGANGLAFKDNAANNGNVFVQGAKKFAPIIGNLIELAKRNNVRYNIFAEVFGAGIQDLTYGQKGITVKVFDVYVKDTDGGHWMSWHELQAFCLALNIPMVPVLAVEKFSLDRARELSEGKTEVDGADQIREGVVVKPLIERTNADIGRVILKYVGEQYLTRKGNTTEYN